MHESFALQAFLPKPLVHRMRGPPSLPVLAILPGLTFTGACGLASIVSVHYPAPSRVLQFTLVWFHLDDGMRHGSVAITSLLARCSRVW